MPDAMLAEIMATQFFCNLHREDDPGSRFICEHIVQPCRDDRDVLFKVATSRFTNERKALAKVNWLRPFDLAYIRGVFEAHQASGGTVFRTKAYKPPMPPEVKGMSTLQCLFEVVLPPMVRDREHLRPRTGDTLQACSDRLREYHGVGAFLAGQIVADLKHIEPLRSASDWWTYVVPGPGSERGLNRLFGRPLNKKWPEPQFRAVIEHMRGLINAELAKHGIAELDGQNTNNWLCEGDKYLRAVENGGKPSRKYKPSVEPLPQLDAAAKDQTTPVALVPDDPPADLLAAIDAHLAQRDAAPPGDSAPQIEPKKLTRAPPASGGGNGAGHYPHGERDTGQPLTFYIYRDARGRNYLGVQRTTTKQFPQSHWDGQRWQKGLPNGFLKMPYRLPELLDAPPDAWVVIAAGEKDAETAAALGFTATTNSSGEGAGQWTPELNRWFMGKQRVAIMEDHDDAGEAHAIEVASALRGIVPDIRIVGFRELNKGGDLTDWVEADRSRGYAALLARIEAAPGDNGAELDEWDAGELLSGAAPEPRQWLIARYFCRSFLSGLVAPGDAGKTTLRLTQAIELATGRELLGQRVYARARVLMLCFEDDRPELHRRLLAICKHHDIGPAELKGWLFCRDINGPKLAELDAKGRRRQIGKLDAMLRRAIERGKYDLVILDPFVKLHGLNENDNPDMDFVCSLLIKIAQDSNIAVDSPAHTHKGAIAAGDADARRGASAQRDAGRLDYTLTTMTEAEAVQFGINPDERNVRLDKAKANIVRAMKAAWFRLVSVSLGNASVLYPDGDEVQAIECWTPPETWAEIEPEQLNAILDEIEAGMPNGQRYSKQKNVGERAVWRVVQKYCPSKAEAQCREMIRQWCEKKVLVEAKYDDPKSRKSRRGLYVDGNKRPQY